MLRTSVTPLRAVGRRTRRIELGRDPDAVFEPARDLVGVGVVGQVAGHQRREARPVAAMIRSR